MNIMIKRWYPATLLAFAVALLMVGCATQLAPPYDKAVAEGLNNTSPEVMTLLASMSNGTDKSTFSTREETYNKLIGKLDALVILAGARPMPKNKVTDTINRLLGKRSSDSFLEDDESTPPSAHAIKKIAETLAKARDTDRKQDLTAYEALGLKGQVVIYFDQAITYENFLQR